MTPAATLQNSGEHDGPVSRITPDMRISDILLLLPEAGALLAQYGLHCAGCAFGGIETLAQGCAGHGYSDEEIRELADALSAQLAAGPRRPATLIVTRAAAEHLRKIADAEGRSGELLEVIADERGGFCMEFRSTVPEGAPVFGHLDVDVRVTASPVTLARVGGATIDFRDERFKLDLPETSSGCCGKEGGCAGNA